SAAECHRQAGFSVSRAHGHRRQHHPAPLGPAWSRSLAASSRWLAARSRWLAARSRWLAARSRPPGAQHVHRPLSLSPVSTTTVELTEMELNSKAPEGPVETRWQRHKFQMKLVNPANRRKHEVIVVGAGLAGGALAATLGEQGYKVKAFCYQDSPRRAHSIAAQGGINAAKNY